MWKQHEFAVEYETCKMCYCIVCLASGKKDPCVWCCQRTSKQVEQFVHLRLKSIHVALKQSSAAINGNPTKNASNLGTHKRFNTFKES